MQCPDCGAFYIEEDLFCGECGRPLSQEATAPDTPVVDVQPEKSPMTVTVSAPASSTAHKRSPVPGRPAVLIGAGVLALLCLCVGALLLILPLDRQPGSASVSAGVLVYEDDFEDSDSGWTTYGEGDTSAGYQDGGYLLGVYRPNYVTWATSPEDTEFDNFIVEVDALQVEGPLDNNFGLLIRYQEDGDDYIWFQVSGDGYFSVDLLLADEWVTLVGWEFSEAVNQGLGVVNHLEVVCNGDSFDFYANGEHLTSFDDSTFHSGNVGLATGTFDEPGVIVRFDDLQVHALED